MSKAGATPPTGRRPSRGPRWDVVATVREPLPLVLAFAAHHLALGADTLWLFFDDPADPAIEPCSRLRRTRVYVCDEGHWQRIAGLRNANKVTRQRLNATYAVRNSDADWLLHIDADEFLWPRIPVAQALARVTRATDWVKLRNLERVWLEGAPEDTIFDGAFRLPLRQGETIPDLQDVYGADARFLEQGLGAHQMGKGAFRTGADLRLLIHSARRPGDAGVAQYRTATDLYLLHFDGLTPRHWAGKMLRYLDDLPQRPLQLVRPTRLEQIRHIRDRCATLDDVEAFHARLYRLSPRQQAALEAAGKLLRPPLDCGAALAHLSPGHHAQLAPAAFDAAIPDIFATHFALKPSAPA